MNFSMGAQLLKQISLILVGVLMVPAVGVSAQAATLPYDAEVVSVSSPIDAKAGETGVFEVVLKNTGTATWSDSGENAVKLGTIAPHDRTSRFYHESWLSENRVTVMSETSVAPGETAHFSFLATAASGGGTISERFGLVAERITWFKSVDVELVMNVAAATFTATKSSQSITSLELKAKEVAEITVQFSNTGDALWRNSGSAAIKVGTTSPLDRASMFSHPDWLSANRVAVADTEVTPGEVGTFTFKIQAPDKIGSYTENFGLVAEGITWMNANFSLQINVVPAVWDAKWVQQSEGPVSLTPGETAVLWVEFENTGNTIWTSSGDNAVKLGTSKSLDRSSIFQEGGWLSDNRVATISPEEVAPGEVARFTFAIKAPDLVGTQHREYFRPVVEMITWLPDFGVYFDISIDEELVLADEIKVGITSTTSSITVQGGAFVVRRGSDKGLVRSYRNEVITVDPLSYGYKLSTGEQVQDWLRIIPMNDTILTVNTSGIGSSYNRFRGIIEIRRSPITGNLWVVNALELEDYMKGIAEVPNGWPIEAQKAQMVAARTFAVRNRAGASALEIIHLYDDTRSQVYYGYNYEKDRPSLVQAAEETAGEVITYQGQPIGAYYFSDSGGYTSNVENVWGKGNSANAIDYLKAVEDPYAKPIEWEYTLTQDYLTGRFDSALGIAADGSEVITGIEVTERFVSNRAKTVVFVMQDGRRIPVPFYTFDYLTDNNQIKSMNFEVRATGNTSNPDFLFTGKGWGHGVGLPQWSARNMADAGKTYKEILTYYYTGVTVTHI